MKFIRAILIGNILFPAIVAGFLWSLVAEGFKYGREYCDECLDRWADEQVKRTPTPPSKG